MEQIKLQKITLKDVARESGVSPTTASRVLTNNGYPVRAEVREKVVEAAGRLGYPTRFPNSSALPYREIAVLVPTVTNPFYSGLISGIEGVLLKENYGVFLYDTFMNPSSENAERLLQSALSKGPRGLIVASSNMHALLSQKTALFAGQGVKVVLADCPVPNHTFPSVYYDYEKGAYLGTEYLLRQGHRRIVYAGLQQERESRLLRVQGFRKAMRHYEIPTEDSLILTCESEVSREDSQIEAGEELASQILAMEKRPTAVFAMNDMVAFGMLRHFHRCGIRVPEDLSLLGFDDSSFCEMSFPGLTTVKVQAEQMGRMTAMLLLDELREVGTPISLSVEPCIVERATVALLKNY